MKKLLLGIMLALTASFALAQSSNWYVGGHFGQAKAKGACDGFSDPGVSCKDTDTSWKVLGGYQFSRNFAAELGYADFGKVRASGPGGFVEAKARAFDLVGVGILPLADRFSVYGKLGAYRGTVDVTLRTTTLNADASDSSTDLTFGGGVYYDITPQVATRAEWQRYQDIGGKDNVDVISVGALFRF